MAAEVQSGVEDVTHDRRFNWPLRVPWARAGAATAAASSNLPANTHHPSQPHSPRPTSISSRRNSISTLQISRKMVSLFSRSGSVSSSSSKLKPKELVVEPSHSPSFPSISSSFLPPPMPGSEEYAIVTAGELHDNDTTPTSPSPFLSPTSANAYVQDANGTSFAPLGSKTPDGRPNSFTISPLAVYTDTLSVAKSKHFSTPITPTMIQPISPITPQPPLSPCSALSPRLSVASSRPAPSSPTPSRHSSVKRKKSQSRRQSALSNSTGALPRASPTASPRMTSSQPLPRPVKVRDFAYPSSDERHLGIHPRRERDSTSSASSTSSRPGFSRGWSGLFAGAANKFGFGFGGGSRRSSQAQQQQPDSDDDSDNEDPEARSEEDRDEDYADAQQTLEPDPNAPLMPGLYRALYAFDAQGSSEMPLEEGQTVLVLGRGGGAGWAVVDVDGSGKQALVPEGYLEFLSAVEGSYDDTDGRETPTAITPQANGLPSA